MSNFKVFLPSLYTSNVSNGPTMTSIKMSIRKIFVTPIAVAKGEGYQNIKTTITAINAIIKEMSKCFKKKLIRFDIFITST